VKELHYASLNVTEEGKGRIREMKDLKIGDLVVEVSKYHLPITKTMDSIGYLEKITSQEDVYFIRLLSTGELSKWWDATFIKVPSHLLEGYHPPAIRRTSFLKRAFKKLFSLLRVVNFSS